MSLRVAVQMDPLESVDIEADTTFALMMEAQERGHQLFVYGPEALTWGAGEIRARARPVEVKREKGNHAAFGADTTLDLREDADIVLMRQDPPFDMSYITAAHILEMLHPDTFVVNDPFWVRSSPEKILPLDYPDLMPETLISRDVREIRQFRDRLGDIIVKPLYGNGGAGVFHIKPDDRNMTSLLEMFAQMYREPFIAQEYLPSVRAGDKRIILIDGEPVGAINRVPAEHDSRSNMHVGGRAEHSELTPREQEICARIGPSLKERGFILVGIDIIGDLMTEINVTSPTGLREIRNFGGPDVAALFWDAVESKRH